MLIGGRDLKAATNSFLNTSGDGLWGTAGNWSLGAVPSSDDNAVVNNGRTATIAAAAPAVGTVTAGNNASQNTTLKIQADLTAKTFRVANATGAIGQVQQSGGAVQVSTTFEIASTNGNSMTGSYTIRGGSLDFAGVEMKIGTKGSGVFEIAGTGATAISVTNMTLGSQAVLRFQLDTLGVTPVTLTGDFSVNATSQLVVDGTDYEGLDGYFPLLKMSGSSGSFASANVSFIGLDGREPALVVQSDGLWLRLLAPPGLSERLCSLVPASTVAADYTNTQFSASRAFEPSGSAWWPSFNESHVMDTVFKQDVRVGDLGQDPNRSWELRVGRGGAAYSLRTPALGETVPPQWRNPNGTSGPDFAPWIDEVWQGVAVDTVAKNASGEHWFIHQAGTYLRDPLLKEPFFSPQVAARLDLADRSFTTVNWGQQAHINLFVDESTTNDFQSHLLYFTRFRDLGQGLVEVSLGFYNFGTEYINHMNVPWGGVRRTSLSDFFLSKPDGTWALATDGFDGDGDKSKSYSETGGWMGFSNSLDGSAPALALAFGFDRKPLLTNQPLGSSMWWTHAGGLPTGDSETNARNYGVFATIRKYNLSQGRGVWGRYYFVLGDDVADVATRIQSRALLDDETWIPFSYTESSSPLVGYRFAGSGTGFRIAEDSRTPQFFLYAHPVSGSFPVFEIIESDKTRYLSWNPYATGVIKTYDGTIAGIRLLGFARRTADIAGSGYAYRALATFMADVPENYKPAGEVLSVRTATPLETWRVQHFGLSDNAGNAANEMDPDSDGLSNFLEYAIGGNPAVRGDASRLPQIAGSSGGLHFTYLRRRDAVDRGLVYQVQATENLVSQPWGASRVTEIGSVPLDDDFETVTCHIEGGDSVFARLRITLAP